MMEWVACSAFFFFFFKKKWYTDRKTNPLLLLPWKGILNNAQSLLGPDTVNSLSELVNPQTLSVFRDQDRWKKVPRASSTLVATTPINNDLLRSSNSWAGIRSHLDAEGIISGADNRPLSTCVSDDSNKEANNYGLKQ